MSSIVSSITAQALGLSTEEKLTLAIELLSSINGSGPIKVKGKSNRKPRDPDAPKRTVGADSYIHLVNKVVWPVLQRLAEGQSDEEKLVTRSVSARTQVAKALWAPIQSLSSEERVAKMETLAEAQILSAYTTWAAQPREAKPKKSEDGASAASAGSKASSKGKLSTMSDEEKKAFYKARGEASAAARAAKKAANPEAASEKPKKTKKAATNPAHAPAAPVAEAEKEYGEEQQTWVHEGKAYLRVYNYLWDAKSGDWVGEWDPATKKIDTNAAEPETE
jgi:hypothetical protein